MLIGHLPAGYITGRLLYPAMPRPLAGEAFLFWAMLGSVAPDADLIYFELFDSRQHSHHGYVTHFPLTWMVLLVLSLLWMRWRQERGGLAAVFALGGLGHMLLDSVSGNIRWLAPFYGTGFSLIAVPARFQPWWLNLVLHWSFALELLLVGIALWLWRSPQPEGARVRKAA